MTRRTAREMAQDRLATAKRKREAVEARIVRAGAELRAAMMSLTAIAHLDFEPERECEHPQHPLGEMGHSGPAWALVEVIHLCASPSRTLVYVCRGGWDEAGARGTHCQGCGENLTRDQSWRIVQVLR